MRQQQQAGVLLPVSKVENAVKSLPTVDDIKKNGVGTLKTALTQLQQNATTAVNQAKTDFSTQTTALKERGGRAGRHRQAGHERAQRADARPAPG